MNYCFQIRVDNLLLTENQESVKLADFGLAREESVTEMMTAETGTYRWMAPEVRSYEQDFIILLALIEKNFTKVPSKACIYLVLIILFYHHNQCKMISYCTNVIKDR